MARGRLISRTLGSSRKFAALQKQAGRLAEFAQALFMLTVANTDDHGRMPGDAFTVKHVVWPASHRTEVEFEAALVALHHVRLICRYEAEGQQVLQVIDFEAHQPGLHKRVASKFPGIPGNFPAIPESPGNSLLREENLTEGKGTEQKGTALTRRGTDPVPNGFDVFWLAYPKKKSRTAAEKVWRKLAPSPELTQRMLDAIAAQRNSADWIKQGGQFIPYPATWLNGQRWEDETVVEAPAVGTRTLALIESDAAFLNGRAS